MKFRYKVLMVNIILLSLGIGVVGYLMIRNNFKLALTTQVKSAVEENNLLQSTIEYRLLAVLNDENAKLESQIANIGNEVSVGMNASQSTMFIFYGDNMVYHTEAGKLACEDAFWKEATVGVKQYVITEEEGEHFLYVCTSEIVQAKNLTIVNKQNISSVYELMRKQEQHFALLLLLVVGACSLFMYFISMYMTKPLEKLNETSQRFGQGDYDARVNISSKDEIGDLADTYNNMAQAVSDHVEELKDMVERQEQFVADFTHEIKTPMTTIIGYADTIRSKEMSRENQIMAASYIFSEGKRLEHMSMKLFDFIYTKKRQIEKKEVYIEQLMEEVADSVLPAYEKKQMELVLCCGGKEKVLSKTDEIEEYSEDLENAICIAGDSSLLKSAFINLLDNARKASEEGSRVRFIGELTEQGYRVAVQDFGVGISEEHVKRICDEFYMVDKSRSRKEGGAGLGLSLAALIAKSHGSEIQIDSKLGEGTTMSVILPLFDENMREEDETDES